MANDDNQRFLDPPACSTALRISLLEKVSRESQEQVSPQLATI
jgi:hypothetical protein